MTRPTLPQLRSRLRWLVVTASLAIAFTSANDAQAVWKISKTLAVTGPGSGSDYVSFDDNTGKLYVPHGSNIVVVDTNEWRQTSSLGGFSGVHGIAVSPDGKFGFATNGTGASVAKVDLSANMIVGAAASAGPDPDGVLYDRFSNKVIVSNHQGDTITVIDPATGIVAKSVKVGMDPESGASDGAGRVFINLPASNQVAVVDSKTFALSKTVAIPASITTPVAAAFDPLTERLFTATRGSKPTLIVWDASSMTSVAMLAIGDGVDAVTFDPELHLVFTTNGMSGTMSVFHQDSPDVYAKVTDVAIRTGCKTHALDAVRHAIYTACNDAAGVLTIYQLMDDALGSSDAGAVTDSAAGAPSGADATGSGGGPGTGGAAPIEAAGSQANHTETGGTSKRAGEAGSNAAVVGGSPMSPGASDSGCSCRLSHARRSDATRMGAASLLVLVLATRMKRKNRKIGTF